MLNARSLLFVPANSEAMIDEAAASAADVAVLDLANSVPVDQKIAARSTIRSTIEKLKAAGKTVHVRVNHLDSGLTTEDLSAAIGAGLDGIVYPKTDAPHQIRELDVLIRQQEVSHEVRPGTAALFPQLGSANGLLRCEEIALASTRIAGLSLDLEAYTADVGILPASSGHELDYARNVLTHCCAAHKLMPLDVAFSDVKDLAGLTEEAIRARSLGFKGKYLIHADQIDAVNRAFARTS